MLLLTLLLGIGEPPRVQVVNRMPPVITVVNRMPAEVPARPFPQGFTPDTTARRAAGLSTSYPVFEPLTGRTGTSARWTIRGGVTNCGPIG